MVRSRKKASLRSQTACWRWLLLSNHLRHKDVMSVYWYFQWYILGLIKVRTEIRSYPLHCNEGTTLVIYGTNFHTWTILVSTNEFISTYQKHNFNVMLMNWQVREGVIWCKFVGPLTISSSMFGSSPGGLLCSFLIRKTRLWKSFLASDSISE